MKKKVLSLLKIFKKKPDVQPKQIYKIIPEDTGSFSGTGDSFVISEGISHDINAQDSKKQTALHRAVANKDYASVDSLFDMGASFLIKDVFNNNPAQWAVIYDDEKMVEKFIKKGNEVGQKEEMLRIMLIQALSFTSPKSNIVNILLHEGISLESKDIAGRTPFISLAKRGNIRALQFLIGKGVDKEASDQEGRTALIYAVRERHSLIVACLVEHDVKIYKRDGKNLSAVNYAYQNGDKDMIEYLVNGYVKNTLKKNYVFGPDCTFNFL